MPLWQRTGCERMNQVKVGNSLYKHTFLESIVTGFEPKTQKGFH